MMMKSASGERAAAWPRPGHVLLAGIAGEVVFEFFALLVAPAVLGTAMRPAMLVSGLASMLVGAQVPMILGWVGHLLAGAVVFPLGYVMFRRLTGMSSWPVAALAWAVILWLFAQGILAPLAGRPFMLGFIPYTWASLVVHALYVATVAFTLDRLEPQRVVGNRV